MKCSVVILNWNGQQHLQRFLGSVVENTPSEYEIIVADNGSSDNSLSWLKDNYPSVKIIVLDKNYGYAGGYNKALKQVDSEIFVLLNSDVRTPKGWLEPLIAKLDNNKDIAAIAPKILSELQPTRFEHAGSAGGFIDILGYPFCAGRIMESIEFDYGQYDNIDSVFWASGACLAIRAEVFRDAGGFDADFFAHMEEIDLCWRILAMGHKIAVENNSCVYHLGGGTLPQNNPRKLYLNYRNNLSMLWKNLRKRNLVWIMPVRFCFDMASAAIFCLQGHLDFSKAVFRAYRDFIKLLPSLNRKRKAIKKLPLNKCFGMLKGSIVIKHMIYGKQYFSQIKQFSQSK